MAILSRRRAVMPAILFAMAASVNAMTYKGCFSSSDPLVDQGAYNFQSSGHCEPICSGLSSGVLGFSGGTDCWCGDQLPAASSLVADSKCNLNCTGYPQEMCGGVGYYTVWLTGLKADVTNYGATTDSTSSTSSTTSSSSSSSSVTSVLGSTVVVTVSASASTSASTNSGGGTNTAGIAAGVVVGIVAVAAIIGGVFFWLRHRRRQQAEEDYKRSAQVSDFMRGASERKAPTTAYSQMSDSRLDPEAGRRNSVGSMADEHDYSRRILRVANPDH